MANKVIGVLVGSVLAAMFTVLSFAIDPKTHMRNYRRAYYELHSALTETLFDSGHNEKNKKLITALQKGEEIINVSYETENWSYLTNDLPYQKPVKNTSVKSEST